MTSVFFSSCDSVVGDSLEEGKGGMFQENSIVYYVYIIYMYIRYTYNIMYIYKKHVYYQG